MKHSTEGTQPSAIATPVNGTAARRDTTKLRSTKVRLLAAAIVAIATFGSSLAPAQPASAALVLDDDGQWGPVEDWPLNAIHAALDSSGNLLTYGTNEDGTQTGRFIYDVWAPNASAAQGHATLLNSTTTDLFCSLQINRADNGNMLLFGGDNWTGAGTNNFGNPDINQFDSATGQISSLPGMNLPRWYATGTAMPDGSIFVQGGLGGEAQPERWTPSTGSQLLPIDTSMLDYYYPRNFVIPDGRIFGIDSAGQMYFISANLDSLQLAGRLGAARRGNTTTAVMFEPGKILHFGGGSTSASIIDVTSGNPVVTPTGQLSSARHWVDSTLLPDGRVLATGGAVKDSAVYPDDPINTYGANNSAEIWDPQTGQWTVGASGIVPRLYHSTSILLPDGRVLTAGGGSPGPVTNTNAEIYSPDYLIQASGAPTGRPTINTLSSSEVIPGDAINITTNAPLGIDRVTLVKTGSVTHSFNMDQRFVELSFSRSNGVITANLPNNGALLTPGYYLLSVVTANGVPSESQMIEVGVGAIQQYVPEVYRLYLGMFGRVPEHDGLAYWTNLRASGVSLVEIAGHFSAAPEFINRYGAGVTNAGFVNITYTNVLGRQAEQAGLQYWVGQLNNGQTRGEMMIGFTESPENIARVGPIP